MGALFFFLVVGALLVLGWIVVLPRVITAAASRASGCEITLMQLAANPFTGHFEARSLRIGQPPGWGNDALLEIPHVEGQLALGSLTEGTLVLNDVRIEVARLVVAVDANGRTNVEAIGPRMATGGDWDKGGPRYATAGLPGWGEGPSAVLVRRLHLRIDRVEVVDHGVQPARILVDDLNFEQTYENVSRYHQLLSPALLRALAESPALWQVLLSSGVLGDLGATTGGLPELWKRAGGAVNSLWRGLEQSPKP